MNDLLQSKSDRVALERHRRDEGGGISLEYLLVAAFAGVLVIIAVAPVLGPAIIDEYTARRAVLYSTFP